MSGVYSGCVINYGMKDSRAEYDFLAYQFKIPMGDEKPNRYTLEQILEHGELSETNKKKLKALKPGKWLYVGKQSRTSDRVIYHLTQEQIDFENRFAKVSAELSEVKRKIKEIIPESLLEQEKELNKQIRNLNKMRDKFYD